MPKDMSELIATIMNARDDREESEPPKPALLEKSVQARVLLDLLPDVLRKNPFEVGQLLEARENYSHYRWPKKGELAIVTALLEQTIRTPKDGNGIDREDIVILCLVHGRWVEYAVESWRFQPYAGPVEG